MPIRLVKMVAITLATAGLAALWFAAVRAPIPSIRPDQIGATANFAYVRLSGRVVEGPTYRPDPGYLGFTLGDEGSKVRIRAYGDKVDALRAEGRIPALGDWVSVAGTLRVLEEYAYLTVEVPKHLEVHHPEAVPRELGSLDMKDEGRRVRVRGEVWAIRSPYKGLTLIRLRDATGSVDVAVPDDLEALTGELPPLQPGQSVEVVGTVALYREMPQVVPASVMDIVPLRQPVRVAMPIGAGQLDATHVGRLVEISGTITGSEQLSAGFKFRVADRTGEAPVFLWRDVYDALSEPAQLTSGAQVRVRGEVSLYAHHPEVVPERPIDVEVLSPPPAVTATLPLSSLSPEDAGRAVTVEGQIVDAWAFSSGFKLTLDDGSGRVVLLLWSSTFDALADAATLRVGTWVQATGRVEVFEGQVQVVPPPEGHLVVVESSKWSAPSHPTGGLRPEDAGRWVTVAGTIVAAESFPAGVRLQVDDGSGDVVLLLWDSVHRRIRARTQLVPGAWVEATGQVQVYRGAVEVVPMLPGDVSVRE